MIGTLVDRLFGMYRRKPGWGRETGSAACGVPASAVIVQTGRDANREFVAPHTTNSARPAANGLPADTEAAHAMVPGGSHPQVTARPTGGEGFMRPAPGKGHLDPTHGLRMKGNAATKLFTPDFYKLDNPGGVEGRLEPSFDRHFG